MVEYSFIDKVLLQVDSSLRNISKLTPLTPKSETIAMMRVNHSGEVCAQALYRGQALFARDKTNSEKLLQAAQEEDEHLQWCSQRLQQLGGSSSILDPLWYCGAYAIGAMASIVGDKFSLGFLAETEFQVAEHLTKHLSKISTDDEKTRTILEKMRTDELKHATTAIESGGEQLPGVVKVLMRMAAKVMTTVAGKI